MFKKFEKKNNMNSNKEFNDKTSKNEKEDEIVSTPKHKERNSKNSDYLEKIYSGFNQKNR